MTTVRIVNLPHTQDEAILGKISPPLRRLRLKSLQTDASCFKSRYSQEVNQPREFWINRLRDDCADHWVAFDTTLNEDVTLFEEEMGGKVVAFLVVLSLGTQPFLKMHPSNLQTDKTMENCETFLFGAIYVDPVCRGRGIAVKLMEGALEKLRNQLHPQGLRMVATLDVRKSNKTAISIYEKLGFERYDEKIIEIDGEEYISDLMKLELSPGKQ